MVPKIKILLLVVGLQISFVASAESRVKSVVSRLFSKKDQTGTAAVPQAQSKAKEVANFLVGQVCQTLNKAAIQKETPLGQWREKFDQRVQELLKLPKVQTFVRAFIKKHSMRYLSENVAIFGGLTAGGGLITAVKCLCAGLGYKIGGVKAAVGVDLVADLGLSYAMADSYLDNTWYPHSKTPDTLLVKEKAAIWGGAVALCLSKRIATAGLCYLLESKFGRKSAVAGLVLTDLAFNTWALVFGAKRKVVWH